VQVVYRDGSVHKSDDDTKADNLRRASEGDVTAGLKIPDEEKMRFFEHEVPPEPY
jgi:hypothetical protein